MNEIDAAYRELLISLLKKLKDSLDVFKTYPPQLVDEGRCTSGLFVTRDELAMIITLLQAELLKEGMI